jgi:uncharacterized repeat protein (TIGR03803 family)
VAFQLLHGVGLLQTPDGNFYGTSSRGRASNVGTVFRISSKGTIRVLHTFDGSQTSGALPLDGLVLATDGSFYATTAYGGTWAGTIFRLTPK